MKSVGEVMAIGRTFEEALQKVPDFAQSDHVLRDVQPTDALGHLRLPGTSNDGYVHYGLRG